MEYKSKFFLDRNNKYSLDLDNEIAPFPKNALIELSNACNHLCVFCNNPRMKRKINVLDKKIYSKFLSQAATNGLNEVGLYATGEPFLVKDINWYIKEAKKKNIKRVYLTTNGSLADLEKVKEAHSNGLDSIKFSINAATPKNYKIIHGKDDFKKVKENLENIYNWKIKEKKNILILGSFIYTKRTENEIELYKNIFSKYFEDIKIFPSGSQGGRINTIIEKISTDNIHRKIDDIKPCDMIWNRLHLTCEGYLTACCIDYELDLVYENFGKSSVSLEKIWNNSLIKKLRKKHIQKKLDKSICKNCLTGSNEKYNKLMEIPVKENNKLKTSDINKRTALASK